MSALIFLSGPIVGSDTASFVFGKHIRWCCGAE